MTFPRLIVFVLLISGIFLPETVGWLRADYSPGSDFLSELGATGAPFAMIVNYFGFLAVGLSVVVLLVLLWRNLPRIFLVKVGLVCLFGVAVGYLGAFFFPCDSGCPATGSYRQSLHNLAGLIEYVGGVGGLFVLYIALRLRMADPFPILTLAAAAVVTLAFLLMFVAEFEDMKGAFQRLADYTIFFWLSYAVLISASPQVEGNEKLILGR